VFLIRLGKPRAADPPPIRMELGTLGMLLTAPIRHAKMPDVPGRGPDQCACAYRKRKSAA
jgi:hypothetical protein